MTGDIWMSHSMTPHFAVKEYDGSDTAGILYLPDGTELVSPGDLIVRVAEGIYRVGKNVVSAVVEEAEKVAAETAAMFDGLGAPVGDEVPAVLASAPVGDAPSEVSL